MAKENQSTLTLLQAAIESLNDIAQEISIAEQLAKDGLVELVIESLQKYDYDLDVIVHCVTIACTLSYSKPSLQKFIKLDGVQVLLAAIEQHHSNEDILINGQIVLNMMAEYGYNNEIQNESGIDCVLKLMSEHETDEDFMEHALAMLCHLATDKELSKFIANEGMGTILSVARANF